MRIRRETVAERCVQLLRRQILEWRLVPGEVVTEESIARDMGVSRPTVREVLNTPIVEGLLTRNPTTRSLCVTRLDCGEINEIYRVRRLLEAAGVRAFGALDDAALQPLAAATATLAAAVATGDAHAIVQDDIACHTEIVALIGSGDLVEFYARQLAKLQLAMAGATRSRSYDLQALRDAHLRLLDLMRQRRIEEAVGFIVARLDAAEKQLLDAA